MNETTRVLRVIGRLSVGGPAIHALLLTERLESSRYASVLVTGTEGPDEGNYLALHGRSCANVQVIATPGAKIDWRRDARALADLYRLMRRYRPDIVHTHTAKAGLLGRIAARYARVPVVIHTYHGHILDGYFSQRKTRAILAVEQALARFTDRIISVSETVRLELLRKGIGRPNQHVVVPLGLDLGAFLDANEDGNCFRRELGLTAEDLIVGIVARLVPIKRHEIFLEAAREVALTDARCHFVIVGDGERRRELQELTGRLGLDGRVRFLGWRADLPRIYAGTDVVVLSSRNEGTPVSLIEAMAAGRAVVATRVGGVADLIEDGINGLLVPADGAGALAEAIRGLLRSPERRRVLGMAAKKRVASTFDSERLVRDIDQLYMRLLREKRTKGRGAHVRIESALKRAFDWVLAMVGLLISSPIWLMVAGGIKLDDGGPVFFRQERWGRGGSRFWVYKFRTMIAHANGAEQSIQATADDPRITRVGRTLRATALDELPQLLNIVKGDMSFVGPRALAVNERQTRDSDSGIPDEKIAGFNDRLQVRPGLTGIAQVYAPRDVARRHKFKYDLFYIRRRSFWLDIKLITLSLWISVSGRWERENKVRH